jgi:bifunctional non-homologous end joining protein LigD
MLEQYREKRDFGRTPEPPPGTDVADEGPLTFVVQKHAASRLHYDFRLEIDGVLKSWPIPKGPSFNPDDKRMAVMVEDHPLDYGPFEGVIPKGEYGAGQVIVWDAGTYSPDEGGKLSFGDREESQERMRDGLARGKLSFLLRGRKLRGSWTLVKTKRAENEWLLIKHKDRFADAGRDVLAEDRSVLSGLTIKDIKSGRLPDRGQRRSLAVGPADLPGARRAPFPRSIEPMQATLTERPFTAADWLFEPKLDGVRAIALIDGGKVGLRSRRGLDSTPHYPALVEKLASQPEPQLILDGEIVALDDAGVPSFQRIQQRLNLARAADIKRADTQIPVFYYVFDLLYTGGYDLRAVPLGQRKDLLRQLVLPSDNVLLVDHFDEDGEVAYSAAIDHGLEGLIAKRRDSVYESGRRSRSWLKIKGSREEEFVVGGYTQGAGGRAETFGALLLGYYDEEQRLAFAGGVGSGFDDRTLVALRKRLDSIRTKDRPFLEEPVVNAPATWVRPELVARVKFTQWTDDGHLRAPSFQGMREDKAAIDVRREQIAPPPINVAGGAVTAASGGTNIEIVLEQLQRPAEKLVLAVEGHKLSLSNLGKELWPPLDGRRALTKRDLLLYLARVSPYLLPHMRDRPITLTRYPNGITGQHFYQKRWESKLPEFVDSVRLYSGHNEGDVEYLICNNLPTLLWLGQLADIELHTWYSRVSPEPDAHHLPIVFTGSEEVIDESLLNYPDFIVFDLDPYIYSGNEARGAEPELNRKAFSKTRDVAFWLKDVLDSLSLSSFVKTTGRTGLHIYVPILRQLDYDVVRAASETLGRFVMQAHPRDVTMEWSVSKRPGKVFFDYNQNSRGKTLASIYSPRPSPEAAVSMPVRWDELPDVYPTDFTILTACDRIATVGDLWHGILDAKHDLQGLLAAMSEKTE